MASSLKSNFQRSQSKVWWANTPNNDERYGFLSLPQTKRAKSKSPKLTHTPPEISTTSWSYRRGSPGSLKSQDSGFSDSDHSHNNISPPNTTVSTQSSPKTSPNENSNRNNSIDKLTPKKNVNHQINTHINQRSPSISSDRSTPPTVIRKKVNVEYTTTCRRISFSAPSSPIYERIDSPNLMKQIDSLNYDATSPVTSNSSINIIDEVENKSNCKCNRDRSIRRGKVITKSTNRKLLKCMSQLSIGSTSDVYRLSNVHESPIIQTSPLATGYMEEPIMMQKAIPQTPKGILKLPKVQEYNNETVIFGGPDDNNNNNTSLTSSSKDPVDVKPTLPTYAELFPNSTSTSTPKANKISEPHKRTPKPYDPSLDYLDLTNTMNWDTYTYIQYSNPLLNNHATSVHFWLDEIRTSYCHEVLSTLQTKSIAQNAVKNIELNSATAGKLIRQLQSKSMMLQSVFDKVEAMVRLDDDDEVIEKTPLMVMRLHETVMEFIGKLGNKRVFKIEHGSVYKKFNNNIASIIDMSTDMHRSVTTLQSYEIDIHGLLEDIHVLKRYLLITIRMLFERLIQLIIDRIEDCQCELILRSNLSLISMLSNMEYNGFASLNDAFVATNSVKVLLSVCVESKLATVRTLTLRALATICSAKETIRQFEQTGGPEILKEIITEEFKNIKRSDPEIREALSVFAQITAPWHEGSTNKIDGLKDFVESLVEKITMLAVKTVCCQTLLLCVASLNNLSRMEKTSIYSLMSNETIVKLKGAIEARGPGASIFLFVSSQISFILFLIKNTISVFFFLYL